MSFSPTLKLALINIFISITVLGIKYWAYLLTGSIALYSDAIESILNVIVACVAVIALRISEKPADDNHPFGHHKAEYFSAVLEGSLIIVAAITIVQQAYTHLLTPHMLTSPAKGLLLTTIATLINGLWCVWLLRNGKKLQSPALLADGQHLLSDVLSSIGVFLGLILSIATGWSILDPLLGLLVAVNILWSGWKLLSDSVGGLMDHAAPATTIARIISILEQYGRGAIQAHDLRTRVAGQATFIEFHLIVPGNMSVTDSHTICDTLEHALRDAIQGAKVTIHVEPAYKAKTHGIIPIASD